jgi:hypothetical protein
LEKARIEAFADFFLRLFEMFGYALNGRAHIGAKDEQRRKYSVKRSPAEKGIWAPKI